jgi:hypothetical protein
VVILAVAGGPVGDETLQVADRDRFAFLVAADALALALPFLRADAAGDARQRVVAQKYLRGEPELAGGDVADECGDVDRDRAPADTLGVFAVKAACRFEHRDLRGQAEVHFVEGVRPRRRVTGSHRLARDLHPLGGFHDNPAHV